MLLSYVEVGEIVLVVGALLADERKQEKGRSES